MAAIADGIELFLHLLSRDAASKPMVERQALNAGIGMCYVLFAFGWLVVWTKFSDKSFSAVLTAGSLVQLLGFLLLTVKVRANKSVAGISSKTLEMYLLFFICRLTSTMSRTGYIPVDRSGRCVYQMTDMCSLVVVVQLLYCVHKTHKWTYQADHDTLPIMPLIPPCLVLAYFVHANLNRSEFFDTVWATSTNLDTFAMLPQLWMMSKVGGQVEGCTSHFVASIVVSRALALAFWCSAQKDLAAEGSDIAGKQIILAHVAQLLLAADFMYYYLRAKWSGRSMSIPVVPGVQASMDL